LPVHSVRRFSELTRVLPLVIAFACSGFAAFAQTNHCAPKDITWSAEGFGLANDGAYQNAVKLWRKKIPGRRELEGKKSDDCKAANLTVEEYVGYPVLECKYTSNGGDNLGAWPSQPAKVQTLNPSVEQLA
jgi:hypothetical protein